MEVNSLTGYYIYKNINNGFLVFYDSVSANETQYLDLNIFYHYRYKYSIQANTYSDQSALCDTLSIIPGYYNFIINDFNNFQILKITNDCSHVIQATQFTSPIALEKTRDNSYVLAIDLWERLIKVYNMNLVPQASFSIGEQPINFVIDENNRIYVLYRHVNYLGVYSLNGDSENPIEIDFGVTFRTEIAYDVFRKNIWFSDPIQDTVRSVNITNGSVNYYDTFYNPGKIYADPVRGGVWICSDSGIVRISNTGNSGSYKENFYISDISINPDNGDCYYSGYDYENEKWVIGKIIINGEIQDEILTEAYSNVYFIQVVPGIDDAGLMILQQSPVRQIIRLDPNGEQIGQMKFNNSVIDVVLD